MIRHGCAPFLECSTRGERRLSAFGARLIRWGNRSIEDLYQSSKRFEDGTSVNQLECNEFYSNLWDWYIFENPDLLILIRQWPGLSDMFGQPGHVCQATELWRIRNK
jgi:hypothetical protein